MATQHGMARYTPNPQKRYGLRSTAQRASVLGLLGLLPPEIRRLVYEEYFADMPTDFHYVNQDLQRSRQHQSLLAVNKTIEAEAVIVYDSLKWQCIHVMLWLPKVIGGAVDVNDRGFPCIEVAGDLLVTMAWQPDYMPPKVALRKALSMDILKHVRSLLVMMSIFAKGRANNVRDALKERVLPNVFSLPVLVENLSGLRSLTVCLGICGASPMHPLSPGFLEAAGYRVSQVVPQLLATRKLHRLEVEHHYSWFWHNSSSHPVTEATFYAKVENVVTPLLSDNDPRWTQEPTPGFIINEDSEKLMFAFKKM